MKLLSLASFSAVVATSALLLPSAGSAQVVRTPYLQMLGPTRATLVWRTNSSQPTDSRVRYGTTLGSLSAQAPGAAAAPASNGSVRDHVVTITGLSPATRYYYAYGTSSGGDIGGDDAAHYFETAPVVGSQTRFRAWIMGDSGNGGSTQAAVRDAAKSNFAADPPQLFLHMGDIAYNNGTDSEFTNNHFAMYADTLLRTPFWPAIGNHEVGSSDSPSESGPYYDGFLLPSAGEVGGAASGTEAYYSFDYANVHFVVLDTADTSIAQGSTQLTWLQADLAATFQDWLVVFFHHPPYTKGSHNSDSTSDSGGRMVDARENILPIIEAAGVDLVMSGHSHIYERSYLIDGAYGYGSTTPSFSVLQADGHILDAGDGRVSGNGPYTKTPGLPANQGTVYVVAGHGGQGAGGSANHPVMSFSETQNGSCLLTVSANTLTLENVRRDGVVSDRFTLTKQSTTCNVATDCDDGDLCTVDQCVNNTCQNSPVTCAGGQVCDGASGQCVAPPTSITFQAPLSGYTGLTDTFISQANANTAYGNQADAEFDGDDPSSTNQANLLLIRMANLFDTQGGPIPAGSQIISASLQVTVFNPGANGDVHEALVAWDGNTTYNTFGGDPGADPSEYGPRIGGLGGGTGNQSADVTASLAAWSQNPSANLGWIVRPTGTDGVQIRSNEYVDAASHPALTVTYVPGATTVCPPTCPTGTACRPSTQQCEAVVRAGFEHGYGWFGSVDTYVAQSTPNTAHGAEQVTIWDNDDPTGTGQQNVYLLKMGGLFDTEGGPVPAGAEISSALLRYWVVNSGDTASVHEALTPWDGNTTWNTFGASPGVDPADLSASLGTALGSNGVRSFDVSAQVQAWSNSPASNYGWAFVANGANDVQVRSNEHAFTWEHPHLNIYYFPPPACVVAADCDDTNLCTIDACNAGVCSNAAVTCASGQTCDPASGQCVQCLSTADCTDGDLCTTDACVGGTCQNSSVSCTGNQSCDPASGLCVECLQAADCADGDLCTTDACAGGVCSNPAVTCVGAQTCDPASGQCMGCATAADCSDADLCTTDVCNAGVCSNPAVTCTGNQSCDPASGACVQCLSAADCSDADLCTTDVCTAGICSNPAVSCTGSQTCDPASGQCIGCASAADCSDGNLCTTDVCTAGVCSNPVVTCTGNQTCDPASGQCSAPTTCPATCPTGTACRPSSQQCEAVVRQGFEHGYGWFGSLDTYLAQSTPSTPHGTEQSTRWDNDDPSATGQSNVYLLKMGGLFDTEGGPIPAGAEISSALLRYWVVNNGDAANVHEALVPWDESTTWDGFGGDPGVDVSEISASIGSASGGSGVRSLDLSAQAQAWSNDPASNLGLVFMPTGPNDVQVRSNEHPFTWEHPHLNIYYFPPPACVVASDCDDGSLCTTDACSNGTCINTAVSCSGNQTCDPASGQCVECLQASDCNDADNCTTDVCNAGVCSNPVVSCSGNQTCDPASGQCVANGNFTTVYQQGVSGYASSVDTFIAESAQNAANGALEDMEWDSDDPSSSGQENLMLLRMANLFDTEGGLIPQGSTIVSATLELTVFDAGDAGSVHESTVAWDASTTYATFGGDSGADATEYGPLLGTLAGTLGVQSLDVTASLAAWSQNPGSNLGWIVLPTNSNGVQVRSSEYSGGNTARPKLTVTYTPPAGCLASCPANTACRPRSQQCEPTTREGFEHGYGWFGSLDTYLDQATPGTAHGGEQSAGWDNDEPNGSGNARAYLLKMGGLFDTEGGPVPAGAEIAQAVLRYWVVDSGDSGTIHEASVAWDETTTWNSFGPNPGIDPTDLSAGIATVSGSNGVQSVDLTTQVQSWSNSPTANLGLVVIPTGANSVGVRTKEHSSTWEHPHLNISYFTNP